MRLHGGPLTALPVDFCAWTEGRGRARTGLARCKTGIRFHRPLNVRFLRMSVSGSHPPRMSGSRPSRRILHIGATAGTGSKRPTALPNRCSISPPAECPLPKQSPLGSRSRRRSAARPCCQCRERPKASIHGKFDCRIALSNCCRSCAAQRFNRVSTSQSGAPVQNISREAEPFEPPHPNPDRTRSDRVLPGEP